MQTGSNFLTADLLKVSLTDPDVAVHVEIGYPERESSGVWVAPLLIVAEHSTRHRCIGEDPQHAIWTALRRLYDEFKSELEEGGEVVRSDGGLPRFDQQLEELLDAIPRRVHFPANLLAKADPSGEVLLDLLRPRIDDSMLREIAEADYGTSADDHFRALLPIRDAGQILDPNRWHPCEVLELIRWSQPEHPAWKPGATGIRGHLMQAFACAVLLRSSTEGSNQSYDYVVPQTLLHLLESAAELGEITPQRGLASFMAWLVERAIDRDRAIYALAFLTTSLSVMRERWSDAELGELATWVAAEEVRARDLIREAAQAPWSWFWRENNRSGSWQSLLERLSDEAARRKSEEPRRALEELALQLLTVP
jgi:hypothetical protein